MSTANTISSDTSQHTPTRGRQREAQQPVTQQECNAAQTLRAMMVAQSVLVAAGDKIESLRQWASGRCIRSRTAAVAVGCEK